MLLDFRKLTAAGDELQLQGEVDIPSIVEQNHQVERFSPVKVDVVAIRANGICRVEGDLRAVVAYQCSRCLDAFEEVLQAPFDESFAHAGNPDDVHIVEGSEVELDAYVEGAVNLALEYRPLCRTECQGLCPVCGCNLNHEQCNCDRQVPDVRWSALEGLLSDSDSE